MAKEEAEIKELSKKLAQNPDSMVFVQLADAHRRAGELEKSIEVCLQGLERHPTYTTARAILGRNYADLGRLDEAANEFRQIEVSDPENIMAHRMLGQIYLKKGQFAEAIVRQQRVLALDPDDATAQELLQEALTGAKQAEQAPAPAPVAAAPAAAAEAATAAVQASAKAQDAQSGTLKVAEIYIKKGAYDEAAEVLQEILAADPEHAVAQQKLREVNEKRGAGASAKAEEEAKAKAAAEEAARKKAEEEAKAKAAAEEAARKKAEEEAKAKAAAEEAARKKAEEEAKAKAAAEEAARKKAEEEAKAKAAAEEAARKKAEEEAKAKAVAEEAARKKAEEEAARAEAEAAAKRAAEEEAKRKSAKLSSEDILSVMAGSSDELISDDAPAKAGPKPAAPAPAPVGLSAETQKIIDDFVKAQAIEACLLLDAKGALLDSRHAGDAGSLGQTASTIFNNTEKAAGRMNFGGLKQIMIVGEDGRQILFVALKAGVLVALTGKQTNLGLLRVAVNDLMKRA